MQPQVSPRQQQRAHAQPLAQREQYYQAPPPLPAASSPQAAPPPQADGTASFSLEELYGEVGILPSDAELLLQTIASFGDEGRRSQQ